MTDRNGNKKYLIDDTDETTHGGEHDGEPVLRCRPNPAWDGKDVSWGPHEKELTAFFDHLTEEASDNPPRTDAQPHPRPANTGKAIVSKRPGYR